MQIKERTFSYHHAQSSLYESQSDTAHIKHWESRIQQETYTSHFHKNHIDTSGWGALIHIFFTLISICLFLIGDSIFYPVFFEGGIPLIPLK